jgi:hypothetical protein
MHHCDNKELREDIQKKKRDEDSFMTPPSREYAMVVKGPMEYSIQFAWSHDEHA